MTSSLHPENDPVPFETQPVENGHLTACPVCGDDAELAGAPGPNEPIDEYTCIGCGRSFLSDGSITFEPQCDVTGCESAAVWCDVGEAGDLWLCAEHAPCDCDSHTGVGEDLWKCDECGEVVRYVDDPNGGLTLTELHPYRNRKVRVELVTPGDRPGNREWWS